ncbi:MAG: pre-peptidase C-terminal domain-containing protein, partial [Planctomycetota bacterium]
FAGFVGVRADVRIGGNFIDGAGGSSNTLAFNNFPQNGDMTFDTADGGSFSNSSLNFRFFRNTIMHEHGHGTGYFHVESANGRFLMEPFIQTNFDGPQFDDVLGLHRGYGDFFEKSNGGQGNDTVGNATDLGVIPTASMVSIGVDGNENFVVTSNETDFVSIDDNSDVDFYSFTVNAPSTVDVTLDPVGPTYLQGPQFGTQASYVTSEFSDLTLQLYDTDGTTLLASQNAGGLGFTESIVDFDLSGAGEYYLRISGAQNTAQMYQLDVGVESSVMVLPGDFDGDGDFACADVDALVQAIVSGENDDFYDLTGEGVVNGSDLTEWLALAGAAELASGNPYLLGDANLDGVVDGQDFIAWNDNKFTSTAAWCHGDFNASGTVDGSDYVLWNGNKFTSADPLAVPEPAPWLGGLLGLGLLLIRRRSTLPPTCQAERLHGQQRRDRHS